MTFNVDGTVIFPTDVTGDIGEQDFFKQITESESGLLVFEFNGDNRIGYFLYFEPWDWYILLSERSDVFYENANNIRKQMIYTIGATVIFAVGIILFFVKKLTDPIRNVEGTIKDIISSNDLTKRVRVEYDDEVGSLSGSFNRMVGDLAFYNKEIKEYAFKQAVAQKREERIRHIFQKYVPGEVIDEVLKAKKDKLLIGKKQDATILFSDIRSFTTMAEGLPAEELVTVLNSYFNLMVGVIMDHNGIIDKFMGDAIMALFGAPVQYGDDPDQAVKTSLEMMHKLKDFNEAQKREQKRSGSGRRRPWEIGIGLNTGNVVVGNIGSDQKMEYTCIGDTVNLASRLEGLTKQYGVPIIISEHTLNQTRADIKTRELDTVRVKGKEQWVTVYELYDDAADGVTEGYEIFREALRVYQSRDFERALELFTDSKNALRAVKEKDDEPSALYINRCRHFKQFPPPEDWDGVFTAKTK